jgi:hypothetical protein
MSFEKLTGVSEAEQQLIRLWQQRIAEQTTAQKVTRVFGPIAIEQDSRLEKDGGRVGKVLSKEG